MYTLFYCDHHDIPLPHGHKFPMEKYKLIRRELQRWPEFLFAPGPLAQRQDLLRVHDPAYLDAFLNMTLDPAAVRRIGFPQVPQLVTRTLSSVGGTLAASRQALTDGFSGVLAGGTHHAYRDFGSGFCVLNDIAVAARTLLAEDKVQRVLIVDLDVHQGDGTAAIFSEQKNVFTFSAHGRHNFPFRKQVSDLDLEFDNGTGDEQYLARLAEVLPRVFSEPADIVFYQAGVDALATDRLGKLALTHQGLHTRDRMVFEAVLRKGVPCVVTQGGGYSNPIDDTVQASASVFRTGAQILRAM